MPPLLAKRLVDPTYLSPSSVAENLRPHGWIETLGPEVCEVNAAAGFAPDPEQELYLNLLFALGPDGKSLFFENDLIGPRQNLKTGLVKQAEIGWCFVTEERLVVHTAHELDTTEEAFRDLRELITDSPLLSRYIDVTVGKPESPGQVLGNGKWSLNFLGDRRLKFKARTKSGGRGISGDKVVLDEGFALTAEHLGALLPTLSARPDPQVLTASSAGLRDSAILRDKRDRGRAGVSPRQLYAEWCDPEPDAPCLREDCDHARTQVGCRYDDESLWPTFMPALGRRITLDTVRAMRQAMPPPQFGAEFMGHWDDPPAGDGGGVLGLDLWADMQSNARADGAVTLVLDVSPDRRTSTIGLATTGPDDRTLVVPYTASGVSWVVPRLIELRAAGRSILEVALHPSSQAGALIPELVEAGIEFHPLTAQELGAACAAFQTGVTETKYAHPGSDDLDTAVANATTRYVGEVELWDRRDRTINISPLVACSTAAYRWSILRGDSSAEPFNVW